MTMNTYSVRITEDNDKIVAWIDLNGNTCIEQPNHPSKLSTGLNWETVEEAETWANAEAVRLTESYQEAVLAAEALAAKELQEAAARQSLIDSANKLDEIHAMLTQLTNNN
jgi:hypothetical protein